MNNLFGIFQNKKKNELIKKVDKKNILSNDFIERMVRVEQRVSASLSEKKAYNETDYYKSLTLEEKKSFEEYLRKKGNVRKGFILVFSLVFLSFFVLNFGITGNTVEGEDFSTFSFVVLGIFIVIAFFFAILSIVKRFLEKKSYKIKKIKNSK